MEPAKSENLLFAALNRQKGQAELALFGRKATESRGQKTEDGAAADAAFVVCIL
jgi:hypothetical protein